MDQSEIDEVIEATESTSPQRLRELLASASPNVRMTAAANQALDGSDQDQAYAGESDRRVLMALLRNPKASMEMLTAGWTSKSHGQMTAVAMNPSTPKRIIIEALRNQFSQVRAAAASNPSVPVSMLWAAATDESVVVRVAAASNQKAGDEVIARCLQDVDLNVRTAAAQNPSATPAQIRAAYDHMELRTSAAANASAPTDVLDAALRSGDQNLQNLARSRFSLQDLVWWYVDAGWTLGGVERLEAARLIEADVPPALSLHGLVLVAALGEFEGAQIAPADVSWSSARCSD